MVKIKNNLIFICNMSQNQNISRLDRLVARFLLKLVSTAHNMREILSGKQETAIPLSRSPAFIHRHGGLPFHRLMPHLVHQFSPAACSVASIAVVLNAARDFAFGSDGSKTIGQAEILERVEVANWKDRVSPKGYLGMRGLPLEMLGIVVERSFFVFRIPYERIEVVSFRADLPDIERRKEELIRRLVLLNGSGETFLIAHFNQGICTHDIHLPHISPVGAFDGEKKRILILDVDPTQPGPYWVSQDTFVRAMTWGYHGILKKFGYMEGGYVWIRLSCRGLR